MKILVIEDDARIASFLVKGLRAQGYVVEHVATAQEALVQGRNSDVDLIVLDLGLPDLDGLHVLRELRASGSRTPIVILTARDDLGDRVDGLNLGADDYIVKPFDFDEFVARIRARLRHRETAETTALRHGALELDLLTRRAAVNGQAIDLTAREFTMLETFMRHAGQVLSREQLLSRVWELGFDPESNVVDVYVSYLRRKIGSGRIETVRGMGYRLAASS